MCRNVDTAYNKIVDEETCRPLEVLS